MGLGTCVIQNGVRFPICVARARLRSSSHTPSKCFPSSSSAQAYSSLSPLTADHRLPLFCTKRTDNEDELSAESEKENSAQPHDDITNIDTSITQKSHQRQTYTVALWVCTAVAFGVGLGFKDGAGKATEFFAGYILEQSLSVDNLFVFVLIFKYFKVPIMYQNRVLSYGIAGAVFFRLTLILLGTATLQRFEAVNLLLAAILLYSSFKLFASEEDESDLSNNFVVKTCQKFIPVTTYYDGNRFITNQDGVWKGSNILGRPHLCFLL